MTLSSQLLWNYWSIYHETWYVHVDRTSYGVMHIGRKFRSPHFCGSYAPWNLENIRKSINNLSFLCQFFINEITASNAGPDIIRSPLLTHYWLYSNEEVYGLFRCLPNVRLTFCMQRRLIEEFGKQTAYMYIMHSTCTWLQFVCWKS